MQFLHNDLGYLSGGEVIEVTLDTAANVKLMDSSDFSSYRNNRRHGYYGGYITRSPFRVAVPGAGHWHVAIDLAGRGGSIRSGVRVIK
jgi:hypothetical protein